jgi:protein TonB
MKPENILQSDLLDILFEDRNKAYGAYYIRRHYQSYLWRAMIIALGLIALVIFISRIQKQKTPFRALTIPNNIAVQPIPIADILPPPPLQKPAAHRNTATERLSTIKIVPPDMPADQPLPDIADLIDKKISVAAIKGDPGDITAPEENAASAATGVIASPSVPEVHTAPYDNNVVDEAAEFPGGLKAMLRFLQRNLQNPENEMAAPVKVRIRFIVDETGVVGDFKIIQSGGDVFDREVLQTLKKMPRWKPAVKNGRRVPVYFVQPITFDMLAE